MHYNINDNQVMLKLSKLSGLENALKIEVRHKELEKEDLKWWVCSQELYNDLKMGVLRAACPSTIFQCEYPRGCVLSYAMKVMTSFGYEIMLPHGFWFQTLDVNKPWCQIPVDRLLFFWCSHS